MEIFKLFGSVMIDNTEADKSLKKTDDKAKGFMGSLGSGIKTAAKWAAGIAAAAGTAAVAIGTVAVKSVDEYKQALNQLQVSTGATNEQMEELGETVKNVYGNNFGENFEDVANSVTLVSKNLRLSGDELQKVTELAIGFRDSFEVDVNESTRSAKALMENFGISAEEAFNLMVQGQQQGLDYSGEFLDSVNEYSVHFKQVGLDAEDMFNVFLDGAESGAFNLDKVGDAVKELGIRVKDGSANEALQALGFDADELVKKFNAGGAEAQEAFYGIFSALGKVEDQTQLNTVGTALMGTQFEDLGKEAVIALGDMSDGFNRTIDSANQMNEIKYSSFSDAIKGIKRQVETNVLLPLGESILPVLNKFANWFKNDGVKYLEGFGNVVSSVMPLAEEVFGTVFDAIGVVLELLGGVFGSTSDDVESTWGGLFDTIKSIWESVGKPIFDAFRDIFRIIIENITPIVEGLKTLLGTLFSAISVAWESVGKPVFTYFVHVIQTLADIFGLVFPILASIFQGLCDAVSEIWTSLLQPIFQAIGDFVEGVLLPIWVSAFSALSDKVSFVFSLIGELWNNSLKPILDGIIDFASGIFTGEWGRVWDGVVSIISGIWEGIKTILWAPIEWFLDKIGAIGDAIAAPFKKAAEIIGDIWGAIDEIFKLPHFTLDGSLNPLTWIDDGMPSIGVEWYKDGGIMTKATAFGFNPYTQKAMVGGEAGDEAILPIEKLREFIGAELDKRGLSLDNIIATLKGITDYIRLEIPVNVGNVELARLIVDDLMVLIEEKKRNKQFGLE